MGTGKPHHARFVPGFRARSVIIGDKASVKEEIARYREVLGVDHFIMRCQWPGLPRQQVLSSIQRLGEISAS
jgi:alkanesulfonate monooxygenase SsuD/methylene tetrahydromethanopterin reductase-like flavin-dependent oxidoreductase (luciferase family)